jgi:hypothetical protein
MKADSNYNMSKPTKKLLATFTDKAQRKAFKDAMIRAEVDYAANKKKAMSSKKETKEAA